MGRVGGVDKDKPITPPKLADYSSRLASSRAPCG